MTAVHITRTNSSSDQYDQNWLQVVDKYVHDTYTSEINVLTSSIGGYNTDITLHELSGAQSMTNQESSPGPDGIFPKFITK